MVSIYSDSRYLTADLDFITFRSMSDVKAAMHEIGFESSSGRYFSHPDTDILVEFPPGPLAIGDAPVTEVASLEIAGKKLGLLTPTQCVMDRLAAYYHWDDRESLEQALLVAGFEDVDLREIRRWSDNEGMGDKFAIFIRRLAL